MITPQDATKPTIETIEILQEVRVWRCIASGQRKMEWKYQFDDYVLETHLQVYVSEAYNRGASRISLYVIGKFKDVFKSEVPAPMRGTVSLARERSWVKIEALRDEPD